MSEASTPAAVDQIAQRARTIDSPQERSTYVRGACDEDEELIARVRAILGADGSVHVPEPGHEAGRAGDGPALGGVPGAGADVRDWRVNAPTADIANADTATTATATADLAYERAGTSVDRYKLLQPLGEGGYGTVFVAEQQHPVRRTVALKIIKLGMDTRQVVARFEAERQALAMMDHPNIAKVFDAGATATGRPYFVMELVKGEPITDYCDKHKLSIEQRLDLFVQVCSAVQHAHQKGIIHRDLKPSNVLVTVHDDGRPSPKVIDFGIAKATASRLTERTLFTEIGQFVGTPEYMSPEQADGSIDLDTRTDVYSLGVLLYELLTGTTPFDSRKLRSSAFNEIQRIIREEEPQKPSTRLHGMTRTLQGVAQHRQIEGRRLAGTIRGELDWIVMKCLEKDRTRRYVTADALAADVQRFRSNQPVLAGPPGTTYRVRKFVRRNRAGVAVGVALLVTLIAGAVGTTVGMLRAKRSADVAQRNAEDARRAQQRAEKTSRFMQDMLQGVGPSVAQGRDTTILLEILDRTVRRLDSGEFKDQPLEEATLRNTIGAVYRELGKLEPAQAMLERALALRTSQLGENALPTAETLHVLAAVHLNREHWSQAEQMWKRAIAIRERILGPDAAATGASVNNLGLLYMFTGRYPEAIEQLQRSKSILEQTRGPEDTSVSAVLNNLGVLWRWQGRLEESESDLRRALMIRQKAWGDNREEVGNTLLNLGWTLMDEGRYEDSRQMHERAVAVLEHVLGPAHREYGEALAALGDADRALGRNAQAKPLIERAMQIVVKAVGESSESAAGCQTSLGLLAQAEGRFADAEALHRRALATRERQFGPDHVLVATSLYNISRCLLRLNRPTEAVPLARRCLTIRESHLARQSVLTFIARVLLGRALAGDGQYEPAEAQLLQAERDSVASVQIHPDYRHSVLTALVDLYDRWNRPELLARRRTELAEFEREHPATTRPSAESID